MLTDVVALVHDEVEPFDLGVVFELFGVDRTDDGVPAVDFAVCAPQVGPLPTPGGFDVVVRHDLRRAASADLVVVPAGAPSRAATPAVAAALRDAVARGARVMSVCTGAFTLADAGLLDGRAATTHWRHCAELASRFPGVEVRPDVLYVEDGPVVTSAGTAAGIDAGLQVWRREHGSAVAARVARRMVVPPQRDGGQAQFIARQVPECEAETLAPVLLWAVEHLEEDLDVPTLASRAAMSPRTFARRFRDETGTTPAAWVVRQRVHAAEELLEQTDLTVEQVAHRVGFGNAATLRHHFVRVRGIAPLAYRRRFGAA
ncbi:helix-turn-helix domain-containing protein [Nocardioides lentus]|uniref:Helix-turn-helix domain-containing protein n=1 Tax=Nocardioides lentus TaxID=338077 RepID=A0ABP5AGZ7_9ACTN